MIKGGHSKLYQDDDGESQLLCLSFSSIGKLLSMIHNNGVVYVLMFC